MSRAFLVAVFGAGEAFAGELRFASDSARADLVRDCSRAKQHHADRRDDAQEHDAHRGDGHDRLVPAGPFGGAIDEPRPPGERRLAGEEAAEIVGQRLGRLIAFVAALGHRGEHDRFEVDRDGGIELSRQRGLFVFELAQHDVAIVAGEGVLERRAVRRA